MKCTSRQTISRVSCVAVLVSLGLAAQPATAPNTCLRVAGGVITAGLLRPRVPQLDAIPESTAFGPAPVPGITRVITARELNAFLRRIAPGIPVIREASTSICVVRDAKPVSADQVRAAIGNTFLDRGRRVRVDLIDQSTQQVGDGTLHFPLSSIPRMHSPSVPVLWRGWHRSQEGLRTPVWARVRLAETISVFVANRDLTTGMTVSADDIQVQERQQFPSAEPVAAVFHPYGCVLRKVLRAGSVMTPADVEAPVLIRRGEPVELQVRDGAVALSVTGKAESTARAGQRVAVSTAYSKKIIQALVQEKGRAILQVSNSAIAAGRR